MRWSTTYRATSSVFTQPVDPLGRIGSITSTQPSRGDPVVVRTVVVPKTVVAGMWRAGALAPGWS
jgi:hypothetical protein